MCAAEERRGSRDDLPGDAGRPSGGASGQQSPTAAQHLRTSVCLFAFVAGLFAFALYAGTGLRGVAWQDSGVHQYRIITGQLEHWLGLALSHPLHYFCGRLAILLGDPPHMLNLMSGLFGAVGVGALAAFVLQLTRNAWAAGLAAATLALTHAYWQMSAVTETYTLAAALMVIEWLLLLRYVRSSQPIWLAVLFFVNGLHVANHLLGLLTLATYGVLLIERVARRQVGVKWLMLCCGMWCIGALPYEILVIQHYLRTQDLAGTLQSALFGGGAESRSWAREVLNLSLPTTQIKRVVMTLGYCLPSAALLLAIWGLVRYVRGESHLLRRVLVAQTIIITLFVARYTIVDLYTFFVPVCAILAVWIGCGIVDLLQRLPTPTARGIVILLLAANAALPVAVYAIFPRIAQDRGWLRESMRDIPFRNEYTHFFRPWRFRDVSGDKLSALALAEAGAGGWILADPTTACTVAAYYAVADDAPVNVEIFWNHRCLTRSKQSPLTAARIREFLENGGNVVAIPSPDFDLLFANAFHVKRSGVIWEVHLPERANEPSVIR